MLPILFEVGPLRVASYGLLVALGYLVGILWLKSRRDKMGLDEDRFWSLIYALFFGAVAGGKLMFMAVNWRAFMAGELHILRDFRYGFVFFGGFLGMAAVGVVYVRWFKVGYLKLADYLAVAGPIGHAIGRIGCLMAGCCHGAPTTLPWGIRFTKSSSLVPEQLLGVPLHPAQLYESLGNLLLAAGLIRLLDRVESGKVRQGTVFAVYMLSYAVLRFLLEFIRADERGGFVLGLSPGQWIAIGTSTAALVILAARGVKEPKKA